LVGGTAGAQEVQTAQANAAPASGDRSGRYGLGVDVGLSGILPDAGLLLGVRPTRWLRIQGGGAYNGIAFGVRGGVTLVNPFVLPLSVTCEVGHFFAGDANQAVRWFKSDAREIASLRRFSYDYLNLLGGLELEGRHVSFYLRGGVTWMRATVKDIQQSIDAVASIDLQAGDLKVSYRGPTLKLGVAFYY
jgi:hypothetical protein